MSKGSIDFKVRSRDLQAATAAFIKAKTADASVVVRKTATGITSELQVNTPVKKGRARAGWSPLILREGGASLVEGPDPKAVQEGRALGEVVVRLSDPLRPSISVANGVHYLPDLNKGRSSQVAPGFFQRILSRWTAHLYKSAGKGLS